VNACARRLSAHAPAANSISGKDLADEFLFSEDHAK
jgi:hypothetical protein